MGLICTSTTTKQQRSSNEDEGPAKLIKKATTFKRGETYYGKKGDESERIVGSQEVDQFQRVEAFITFKNIRSITTTYQVRASICNSKETNIFTYLGETEKSFGNEIIFGNTFVFDYFFERQQTLKFQIVANDADIVATFSIIVGVIMGSRGSSYTMSVNKDRTKEFLLDMIIDCKNASLATSEIRLVMSCKMTVIKSIVNLFYVILNFNDGKNWRPVYKSDEIDTTQGRENRFNEIVLKTDALCLSDANRPILIEFYNSQRGGKIGGFFFTLAQLRANKSPRLHFSISENPSPSQPDAGFFNKYNNHSLVNANTSMSSAIGDAWLDYVEVPLLKFVDYIKGGMQINLVVGIDFTSSNGKPDDPNSLHYANGNTPNSYEKAIRACGEIVGYYDSDQLFPVYGFGGIPPGSFGVSHCFNLNFSIDPNIKSLDSIISTYRSSLFQIKFACPTLFRPLIETVLRLINKAEPIYYILMILTDGLINDMDPTCDILVECAVYPLSVIIIGVGDTDFTNMRTLDGDEIPLTNTRGEVTKRDLVQFVEFNKFQGINDATKLAEEVLQEVPRQVEEYYRLANAYR